MALFFHGVQGIFQDIIPITTIKNSIIKLHKLKGQLEGQHRADSQKQATPELQAQLNGQYEHQKLCESEIREGFEKFEYIHV